MYAIRSYYEPPFGGVADRDAGDGGGDQAEIVRQRVREIGHHRGNRSGQQAGAVRHSRDDQGDEGQGDSYNFV